MMRRRTAIFVGGAINATALLWASAFAANAFNHQPALGEPLISAGETRIYAPWKIIEWSLRWGEHYPRPFAVSHLIVAGAFLTSCLVIDAMLRRGHEMKPFGEGAWSDFDEAAECGLFAPSGPAGFREILGPVLRFAPTHASSHAFNPVLEVRRGPNEVRDVQNIVEIRVDPGGDARHQDFWDHSAKHVLVGVILHVPHGEPLARKTLAVVREKLRDLDATAQAMKAVYHRISPIKGAPEVHPEVLHAAESFLVGEERLQSGIKATADMRLDRLIAVIGISAIVSVIDNNAEDEDEDSSLVKNVGDAAAQEAARTGGRIIDRELSVRPTLRVRAGAPLRVLVMGAIQPRPHRPR